MGPTLATLCLCTVIAVAAVIYDQLTKRIPSRLRAGEAPQSPFGLVRADKLSSDEHAPAHGIEHVRTTRRLCIPINCALASSSFTASARTLTRRGERKIATGSATSSHKTSLRRFIETFESSSTTTTRTGRGMPYRRAYQVWQRAWSTVYSRGFGEQRRLVY